MKIFSAKQLKEADQVTIERQNISSWKLMERAATLASEKIIRRIENKKVKFFCGIGNNGGDGLVIARKLIEADYDVKTYIVEYSSSHSKDFEENMKRLQKLKGEIVFLNKENTLPEIKSRDVVVDAVFGIGLNRPLPNWVDALVVKINKADPFVVAIDMPSGLFSDRISNENQHVLKADLTLTFQSPKLVFFLPETAKWIGELEIINIGLDQSFLQGMKPEAELITKKLVSGLRKPRKRFSHKGTYGHCLVVGGSYGKIGSMVLATKSALRVGAGKVSAMIPRCGYEIMQTTTPEAMVLTTEGNKVLNTYESPEFEPEVICFGMGAGTGRETADFFMDIMKSYKKPILIDADGINLIAKHDILKEFVPENSVLTPHPKELERLIGKWKDDFDKLEKIKEFVERYKVVLVVKGAYTMVISPKNTFINRTGNPGMATAGSGDVLSGVIAGLMAQGYLPKEAAIVGVYIHGKAGDVALKKFSPETLIAGDLINNFAEAFRSL